MGIIGSYLCHGELEVKFANRLCSVVAEGDQNIDVVGHASRSICKQVDLEVSIADDNLVLFGKGRRLCGKG